MDILTEVDLRDLLNREAMWAQRFKDPSSAYQETREIIEEALAVPDPKVDIEEHPQKRWLRER